MRVELVGLDRVEGQLRLEKDEQGVVLVRI